MLKPVISVMLDTRRALRSGLYPIKLRATFQVIKAGRKAWVRKYYPTGCQASVKDFEALMTRPRNREQSNIRAKVLQMERRVLDEVDKHPYVTPELLEKLIGAGGSDGVLSRFDAYIAELKAAGRVGNMVAYQTARNSFEEYAGGDFSFYEVTQGWLEKYAAWMQERERSTTSTAIYLRALRKVFNDAVALRLVSAELYPFGKRRYTIQSQRVPKEALSEQQKNQLLLYRTEDPLRREAVDFFLLSYFCNGVNMNDVLRWKGRNIQGEVIVFKRGKTARTSRMMRPIVVVMREEVRKIISRYGAKTLNPDGYVFPVLDDGMGPEEIRKAVQAFTKRINQGLKAVADELGLGVKLTTYTARHTFANISLLKGASKEFIQEALGHQSIMTTESYISGFDLETKKKMSGRL